MCRRIVTTRTAPTSTPRPPLHVLRLLSIRNFVVVEALELEFERGFTVLTGETGAGKSILLDALGAAARRPLRDCGSCAPAPTRAELAAEFDIGGRDGRRRVARGRRISQRTTTRTRCCCAACWTRRARAARGSTAGRRRSRS